MFKKMKCKMLDQVQKRGLTFRKVMQRSTNIKIVEVLPRNEFINTNPFFFFRQTISDHVEETQVLI